MFRLIQRSFENFNLFLQPYPKNAALLTSVRLFVRMSTYISETISARAIKFGDNMYYYCAVINIYKCCC